MFRRAMHTHPDYDRAFAVVRMVTVTDRPGGTFLVIPTRPGS
jgi:hypothetical protein